MQKQREDVFELKLDNKNALERVTHLVRMRLVECGWRDQVRLHCRRLIEENGRLRSVDELAELVTPLARSAVPDSVKRELLHELEGILGATDKIPRKKSV